MTDEDPETAARQRLERRKEGIVRAIASFHRREAEKAKQPPKPKRWGRRQWNPRPGGRR